MSGQNTSIMCRCCTSCMRRVCNNASVSAAQPQGAMLYHVAAFMEAVLIRSHRTPRCLRGALLRSELCAVGAAPPARMVYAGGPQRPAVFVSGVLHRLRPALQPHRQCGGGGVAAREQECCRGAPAAQPPAADRSPCARRGTFTVTLNKEFAHRALLPHYRHEKVGSFTDQLKTYVRARLPGPTLCMRA